MAAKTAKKNTPRRKYAPPHNKYSYTQLSVNPTLNEYDGFGRNVRIGYPYMQDAVYEYGPPGAADRNLAGRLIKVTDASGTIEYAYGKLGETAREKRALRQETGYLDKEREAVMEYAGNYLGQMEKITYPDGEEVSYGYDYGGNVTSVTGKNHGTDFNYVEEIGYDEWGQRAYLKLGNGAETTYRYDGQRRWLAEIKTNKGAAILQNINYRFDLAGNVSGYENNNAGLYTTKQDYTYDALYQLTRVEGESRNYRSGVPEYTARYSQEYQFDEAGLGNMTLKASSTANMGAGILGDALDYQLDYEYIPGTRKARRIGDRHYQYDMNGNLTAEQDGPFAQAENKGGADVKQAGSGAYYVGGAWGLDENGATGGKDAGSRRDYLWDERNRLSESADSRYSVRYAYGPDGERTGKYAVSRAGGSESETLYFNKMWSWRYDGLLGSHAGTNSKHIFLGDTRVLTKVVSADGSFVPEAEKVGQYYYHSDHLGSAQLITDYRGEEYERLEYTPYGELWIEKASPVSVLNIPYRFTGKERDAETGLYYYGARYLDSRTGRWLSGDPAMGEYVPSAPVDDGARKHNGSLPGQGGVFNYVNLHVYHYAGNNPVKLVDPDGKTPRTYSIANSAAGEKGDRYIFVASSMYENVVSSVFKDTIPFAGGKIEAYINARFGFRNIVADDKPVGVGSTLLELANNISGTVSNVSTFAGLFKFSSKFLSIAGYFGLAISIGITIKNARAESSQRVSVDLDFIIEKEFGNLLSASTHERVAFLYFHAKERMEELYADGTFSYTTGSHGIIYVTPPKNGEFDLLGQELRNIKGLMGE